MLIFYLFHIFILLRFSITNKKVYDILKGNGQKDTFDIILEIALFFIYSFLILFSLYYIFIYELAYSKLNVFLFGSLLFLAMLIVIKIMGLRKDDAFSSDLENLEYEINVKNLNNDEIKLRLQKQYMGFLLSEWTVYHLHLINTDFKTFNDTLSLIIVKRNELNQMDKGKYPHEYKARTSEIEDIRSKAIDLIDLKLTQLMSEIKNIIINGYLSEDDNSILMNFYIEVVKLFNFEKIKDEFPEYNPPIRLFKNRKSK
jgi:hypothetical protein